MNGRAKGRYTSIVREDNCLRELTHTENWANREAQRWQPHRLTTLCGGIINITHKLHEMKSEESVLPNPRLEEEEEEEEIDSCRSAYVE
jgi:hypothetical protein